MDESTIGTPRQAGIYVRKQRERLNLTRAQLALKSGVSERLIASLELGDAPGVRLDKLVTILNALDLSLSIQPKDAASTHYSPSKTTSNTHHPPATDECPPSPSSYENLYRNFVARQDIAVRKSPARGDGADSDGEAED